VTTKAVTAGERLQDLLETIVTEAPMQALDDTALVVLSVDHPSAVPGP
jgi:hypothetical protein